jgi:protein-S-isoprenylcysteine O-methyltransferase Ste14
MDAFRYTVALILVVSLPPAFLFWMLIHPFVHFWRRLGPAWTYGIVGMPLVLGMAGIFRVREPLLATEFGTRYPLVALGGVCLLVAGGLRWRLHRHLSNRVLAGLPELAPERYPPRLVTEGLHARLRHPRYLQFALVLLGYALLTNYLALYLLFVLWLPGLYVIAVLEERELHDRFGQEYEDYCRRVPRFMPRLRSS